MIRFVLRCLCLISLSVFLAGFIQPRDGDLRWSERTAKTYGTAVANILLREATEEMRDKMFQTCVDTAMSCYPIKIRSYGRYYSGNVIYSAYARIAEFFADAPRRRYFDASYVFEPHPGCSTVPEYINATLRSENFQHIEHVVFECDKSVITIHFSRVQ